MSREQPSMRQIFMTLYSSCLNSMGGKRGFTSSAACLNYITESLDPGVGITEHCNFQIGIHFLQERIWFWSLAFWPWKLLLPFLCHSLQHPGTHPSLAWRSGEGMKRQVHELLFIHDKETADVYQSWKWQFSLATSLVFTCPAFSLVCGRNYTM